MSLINNSNAFLAPLYFCRSLYDLLSDLENDKNVVIVKGAGEKLFSAGGDVKDLVATNNRDTFRYTLRSYDLVSSYKKPYVAIMNGLTMGGASVYSIAGKYKIATENTQFAMPETAIGFFNDAGSSYFLSRLKFNVGLYIGLTGARLEAYDVKKVGLASHFVNSSRLEDLEKQLAICKSHQEIENVLKKFSSEPSTTETELDLIKPRIDQCFDGDTVEEIYGNLHLDGSDWAMKTIRTLNKKSPTSLKVSLRTNKLGKKMSLRDCLQMEYQVGVNHFENSDLNEGVRAVLIDKDFKPNWKPKTIQDVTEENIARFFKQLPDGDKLTFESH